MMSHEQTDSLDGTLSQSIRNTDSHAQLKTQTQRYSKITFFCYFSSGSHQCV